MERIEPVTADKFGEFGTWELAAVYLDKVGVMNFLSPDSLYGMRYAIGLEFGPVVGALVGAEADGLAGYPATACANGMNFSAVNNQGYKVGLEF